MNMLPVCEEVIKDIQTVYFHSFGMETPHKIASNVIITPIKYGGLKMPDFSSLVRGTQISWVPRIMKSNSRWNNIFQNAIQPITKEFLFQCKFNPNHLDVRLPLFYKQIVYLFQEMFQNDNPIENNTLWFNDRLTIENKTIFYLDWFRKAVWQVCDRVDDNGNF